MMMMSRLMEYGLVSAMYIFIDIKCVTIYLHKPKRFGEHAIILLTMKSAISIISTMLENRKSISCNVIAIIIECLLNISFQFRLWYVQVQFIRISTQIQM